MVELVGESPEYWGTFTVPAARSRYRIDATTTRPSTLTTRVHGVWEFASEHEAGEDEKPLPLMAVRFAPDLDDHNRARAGRPLVIPVVVQ